MRRGTSGGCAAAGAGPAPPATVIGAGGFIGRHLVRRLRAAGRAVHEASRRPEDWLGQPLGEVYYCAGLTADFAQRPHDAVQAHVSLLSRVLREGCFDALVYLSSTRLYDTLPAGGACEGAPLALDPEQPRHLYDLSKALGESLCHVAGGGRARVARLSCVVHDDADAGGFLPRLLHDLTRARRDAAAGRPPRLQVDASPQAARDYVLLDDVLDALLLIASRGTQGTYNVASGRNLGNRELFARLRELCGVEIVATRHQPQVPPPRVAIARLRDEFGWRPTPLLERLPQWLGSASAAATRPHDAPAASRREPRPVC